MRWPTASRSRSAQRRLVRQRAVSRRNTDYTTTSTFASTPTREPPPAPPPPRLANPLPRLSKTKHQPMARELLLFDVPDDHAS